MAAGIRGARGALAAAALGLAISGGGRATAAPGAPSGAPAVAPAQGASKTLAVATVSAAPVPPPAAGAPPSAAPAAGPPASGRGGSAILDPAPRPVAAVRVQPRFATKAKLFQLFGSLQYLSRGDFYDSPGVALGAAYAFVEPLAIELQVSHFWSSLDAEAEQVRQTLGALPDSHAPAWLALVGARYSIGYGKVMVGGVSGVIHFEPQAFVHVGVHDHSGDVGPSGDAGLGFLVYLRPTLFARIDAAVVLEREQRSGKGVAVWGTLPSIGIGGML